jgi:hypothetical protein
MEDAAPNSTGEAHRVDIQTDKTSDQENINPPACPILSRLYGTRCFPKQFFTKDVPVSSMIAACWPTKDAKVCTTLWQIFRYKHTITPADVPLLMDHYMVSKLDPSHDLNAALALSCKWYTLQTGIVMSMALQLNFPSPRTEVL